MNGGDVRKGRWSVDTRLVGGLFSKVPDRRRDRQGAVE